MYETGNKTKTSQSGMTLLEALVALLVLALGILGLAQVQVRMLVETRTTNSRSVAIRLIADLGERIRLNAHGAQPGANPLTTISPYSDAMEGDFPVVSPDHLPPANICNPVTANNRPASCTPVEQALYDVWAWRLAVAKSLMGGAASIWQVSPQQLRVIVAWRLNENRNIQLSGSAHAAADRQYQQLDTSLQITTADGMTNLCGDSPGNYICHVDFIGIPVIK